MCSSFEERNWIIPALAFFAISGCVSESRYQRPSVIPAHAADVVFSNRQSCPVVMGHSLSIEECRGCADGFAERWLAYQNARWSSGGDLALDQYDCVLSRLADPVSGRSAVEFRFEPRDPGAGRQFLIRIDRFSGEMTLSAER